MNEPVSGTDEALDARARRIDLAHEPDFTLGPITVHPSLRKISGPEEELMIEPKVMQVLVALAYPVGTILSRDDLIERCWEGRIVGDTSINRVISLVRSGLKKAAGDAVKVENVPKVGYRLVVEGSEEPVAPERDAMPAPARAGSAQAEPQSLPMPRRMMTAAALVAALIALVVWASWPSGRGEPLSEVSIAMLPLETGEETDPIYARGLESELRLQFARAGAMEVTNSESARLLVAEGFEPADVGQRLQADYVWTGKFGTEVERVTLEASLIEVETGREVWSEFFASAPESAQTLPVRAARAVAASLGRPVSARMPDANITATGYNLYLTAQGLLKSRGLDERRAAMSILEPLTQEHPDFADGWAGLAKARYLSPDPDPSVEGGNWGEAKRLADHALTLDPNSIDALKVSGSLQDEAETSLDMLRRATSLDPGDSEAWFWLSIKQRQYLLEGGDPLVSARRMVGVDPLWPATWRASDMAAEFGRLDEGFEFEARIASAAVTPSQQYLSEARIARLRGDLSTFVLMSRRAARTQTDAERRYGSQLQIRMLRFMLGLPILREDFVARESPPDLVAILYEGRLPTREKTAAEGMGAERFWRSPTYALMSMPLYLKEEREEELLEFYDGAFNSHEKFLEFTRMTGSESEIVPTVAPYLVLALRKSGREDEADEFIRSAEEVLARWKAAQPNYIKTVLWDAKLAGLQGDMDRAASAIERLPDFGWPYTMGHIDTLSVSLLYDDPAYASILDEPRVRAVLDPIRANLAKERREVLALDQGDISGR